MVTYLVAMAISFIFFFSLWYKRTIAIIIIMCNSVCFSVYHNKAIKAQKTQSAKIKPTTVVSMEKTTAWSTGKRRLAILSKVAALSLKDSHGDDKNKQAKWKSDLPTPQSHPTPSFTSNMLALPPPSRKKKARQLCITAPPLSPVQCEQILDAVFADMDDSFFHNSR